MKYISKLILRPIRQAQGKPAQDKVWERGEGGMFVQNVTFFFAIQLAVWHNVAC
jgi:hypothetical protein